MFVALVENESAKSLRTHNDAESGAAAATVADIMRAERARAV
jgi:hypothetical protein